LVLSSIVLNLFTFRRARPCTEELHRAVVGILDGALDRYHLDEHIFVRCIPSLFKLRLIGLAILVTMAVFRFAAVSVR
jgi:hypothetical protein